jgi:hypothetical protein
LQLCALPASVDQQMARRIDQVIGRSQQK